MHIDWSPILQAVLVAVLPPVAAALAMLLYSQAKALLARAKADQPSLYHTLTVGAHLVVVAAEAAKSAGLIDDKKAWAMDRLREYLAQVGVKVDLELVGAAIEKAVFDEFNGYKVLDGDTGASVSDVTD